MAVFFSIPTSALPALVALQIGGGSINSMVLGGLALAFSRLIDNSVVVLENIHRHLEMGEPPLVAAENGGREMTLPVLAATLTTVVVFFPVTLLYGVSKFLFTAMALAVILSMFASFVVAMTVVPLFCAKYMRHHAGHTEAGTGMGARFNAGFQSGFERMLKGYDSLMQRVLDWPVPTLAVFGITFAAGLLLFPRLGLSFFPRTDAG